MATRRKRPNFHEIGPKFPLKLKTGHAEVDVVFWIQVSGVLRFPFVPFRGMRARLSGLPPPVGEEDEMDPDPLRKAGL